MGKDKLFSKTGKKAMNPMEAFRKKEREREKKKKKGHFHKDDHGKAPNPAIQRTGVPKKHNQSTILQNNVTLKLVDTQNPGEIVHSKKESTTNEQGQIIITKRKDEQYINYFENNPEATQALIEEKHRLREGGKAGPPPLQNVLKTINKQEIQHISQGKTTPNESQASKTSLAGNLSLQEQHQQQQQAAPPKKEEKKIGYKFSYKSPFDADPFDPLVMLQKNQLPRPPVGKGTSKQKVKESDDPFYKTTLDESYNPAQKKVHKPEQPPVNLVAPPQMTPGNTAIPTPTSQPVIQQPPTMNPMNQPLYPPQQQLPPGGGFGGGAPTSKPISSSAVIVREASLIKTPQTSMKAESASLIPVQLQKKKQAANTTPAPSSNPALSSFLSEINKLG